MAEDNNSEANKDNVLYWKFDVSTFRLLGRELITDRITALFELVKNCYDANSTKVIIEFIDVNPISKNSKIIIWDNGYGMSLDDIKNKWMIIGTSNKRSSRISPAPFYRKLVGKKGVGRFAVDKLGSKLLLRAKQEGQEEVICLELNWKEYEDLSNKMDLNQTSEALFTNMRNVFWMETAKRKESHGVKLEVSEIRDFWSKQDIERSYIQLSKLVSPIELNIPSFEIIIKSQYDNFRNIKVKNTSFSNASEEIKLSFNKSENTQEVLKHSKGILEIRNMPLRNFGPIKLRLLYFDLQAKRLFSKEYQGTERIDGIKIYRDGIITTPFAEYAGTVDEQRDILGIDKRRWSGFFDKVSSRDIIGYLDITDFDNPEIIDSTNRQDFVDNIQYQDLKRFIVEQLIELEEYLAFKKKEVTNNTKSGLKNVKGDIKDFSNLVREIKKTAPAPFKERLTILEKTAKLVQIQVSKGIKAFDELEKEKVRQENLFMSIMSLQDYAFEIAHVINTSLSLILGAAEFIKNYYPNSDKNFEDQFKIEANRIFSEMTKLNQAVVFLLSYAQSNISFVKIDIKKMTENLFNDIYVEQFEKKGISTEVNFDKNLIINHNEQFFRDIFQNLITNSIKAVEDNEGLKLIKCSGRVESDKFILLFSDNGPGISEEDKERVFNIYFTRTEEKGGAGIGLYIVKKRIEAMKGSVQVIENEFKPTGTTIQLVLPFAD